MKQSLQLKMGQQLAMTPQLQQAIRMLQMSTLELQQEIQQALDENPLLEREEDEGEQAVEPERQVDSSETDLETLMSQSDNLSDNDSMDTRWEDTFVSSANPIEACPNLKPAPVRQSPSTNICWIKCGNCI